MFEFGGKDDFQLSQAVNFLEGRPVKQSDPSLVAKTDKPASGDKNGAGKAEKKNDSGSQPVVPGPQKVEHYRVTPNGIIKSN